MENPLIKFTKILFLINSYTDDMLGCNVVIYNSWIHFFDSINQSIQKIKFTMETVKDD